MSWNELNRRLRGLDPAAKIPKDNFDPTSEKAQQLLQQIVNDDQTSGDEKQETRSSRHRSTRFKLLIAVPATVIVLAAVGVLSDSVFKNDQSNNPVIQKNNPAISETKEPFENLDKAVVNNAVAANTLPTPIKGEPNDSISYLRTTYIEKRNSKSKREEVYSTTQTWESPDSKRARRLSSYAVTCGVADWQTEDVVTPKELLSYFSTSGGAVSTLNIYPFPSGGNRVSRGVTTNLTDIGQDIRKNTLFFNKSFKHAKKSGGTARQREIVYKGKPAYELVVSGGHKPYSNIRTAPKQKKLWVQMIVDKDSYQLLSYASNSPDAYVRSPGAAVGQWACNRQKLEINYVHVTFDYDQLPLNDENEKLLEMDSHPGETVRVRRLRSLNYEHAPIVTNQHRFNPKSLNSP